MKNHLLVITVLAIFPILNCSYAQSCDTISLDTLTVEKYGQTFKNGTAVDFVYQFVYPTNNTPAIRRIREQMIQSFKLSTNELLICNEMSVNGLITAHRGYQTKLKEFKKVVAEYCQELGYI